MSEEQIFEGIQKKIRNRAGVEPVDEALEDLSDDAKESWKVIQDLADENYETLEEQMKLAELIQGLASVDNDVANFAMKELDGLVEELEDVVATEFDLEQ